MIILSFCTYPHVIPNPYKLSSSSEHNLRYFGWEPGGLWLSHWLPSNLHCNGPEKYEKHRQDTPSVISGLTVTLWSVKNTFCTEIKPGWYRRVYAVCVQGIIAKMALRWLRGDVTVPKCWIKSLFLFYFCTKRYSCRFITLRLNHWWLMEYPGDAFLGLDCGNLLGSQRDSHKPPGSHPKYLKLCSEDELCLYGFGTTWG